MESGTSKTISWADFEKVEMRVGTIVSSQVFEKAWKPAYIIEVDFGDLGIKKTSAQVTLQYTCEDLIGKQIVGVVNFPPKQIANIKSEFLLLGAIGDAGVVTILQTEKPVTNGQRIG